jgi:hypothetical protein
MSEPTTEPTTEPQTGDVPEPDTTEPVTEPDEPEPTPEPVQVPGETDPEQAPAVADPNAPPPDPEAPPAEPAPTNAFSEIDMEKAFKDVDRLRKDVAGRVGRIFGDNVGALVECPLCADLAPGWIWSPEVAPLPDEQKARVLVALGFATPKSYKHLPGYETCPTCDGEGSGETGSKRAGYDVVDCPRCKKMGYVITGPIDYGTAQTNGEHPESLVTGPTVNAQPQPAEDFSDDPAVKSLTERGFLVVPPVTYAHG